jgi:hypothetical protein
MRRWAISGDGGTYKKTGGLNEENGGLLKDNGGLCVGKREEMSSEIMRKVGKFEQDEREPGILISILTQYGTT